MPVQQQRKPGPWHRSTNCLNLCRSVCKLSAVGLSLWLEEMRCLAAAVTVAPSLFAIRVRMSLINVTFPLDTPLTGTLVKMPAQLAATIDYQLAIGEHRISLNDYLGQSICLTHTGQIFCSACCRKTNKSYAQGHCFPCMRALASCDMCIMKPETCHYFAGTCREPEWGEQHCMVDHIVYLANTSGLKVGITRQTQVPTRWIDQGATQALPILRVATRQLSGLVEVALAELVADKTNWRTMLKAQPQISTLKPRRRVYCLLFKLKSMSYSLITGRKR